MAYDLYARVRDLQRLVGDPLAARLGDAIESGSTAGEIFGAVRSVLEASRGTLHGEAAAIADEIIRYVRSVFPS